ncbi:MULTISPECIES: phosphoribosylglycinamide formyltransferase [Neobacillus]|jgi:phosphoribosylglycinamide formyltransferase 1|uniref:Phosphoribosylglycinamide formyltransferase n=2 Tax=Neobacillus TaxID=2675232 RepID=A0A6B3TSX8_9BACI|nr:MULTISPECIES: phosphoribosylglycinamide formyltransferase [Neobacillus]AIM16824.1 phosphoribosylglycinamide formyltransferase [Bacillus sp. X1(2014)]MCD4839141.1 phosphoribosylglycinamide formyltransferase [Neobacillus sedimentimangrovi]NEX80134.1 phosphoribosylglycinamide formyltransferase [Neobacillus thermocopriae]
MKNFAVFASGSGSNFQAIVDAVKAGEITANLSLLVCDKPGAYVVQRANQARIPTFVFNPKDYPTKADFEKEIVMLLKDRNIDLIVLAGYMRLIGPTLLKEYEGRIVNIHPSLLPDFPGKDAIGQALAAKAKWSGVTIHYVDEGMDTGPIIVRERVRIEENETRESLQKKIQEKEHKLYPSILQMLLTREDVNHDKKTCAN